MRKIQFATIFLWLAFINSQAQSISDKGVFSIQLGPSFPIGDYANKNVTDPSSGVAVTGETVKLSYISLLSKQWGIAVSLHGQRNAIDAKSFETAFTNTGYSNWIFNKAAWLLGSLLAGGYGQFAGSATSNFSFTTKAMVGVALATSPKLSGNSSSPTAEAHAEQTSKSAVGLSYLVSCGIRYNLTKKLCFVSDLEYLGTPSITFKNVQSTLSAVRYVNGNPISAEQYTNTVNGQQRFSSINLVVGVGLRL